MPTTKNTKQSVIRRMKTIEGHLAKITKMIEEGVYCIDVIQQTTAVKNAIASVEALILDDHLNSCVIRDIKAGNKKSVEELLLLFKKRNK